MVEKLLGYGRFSFVAYAPAFVPLILVMALQLEVGTDYWSYIEMARGDHDLGWIRNNNEILFIWLNDLVILLGEPQLIFLFSAFIQIVFLMLIFRKLKSLQLSLAIGLLLYFILTSIFFSSMNGVRQYIAVCIFIYAFINYYSENYLKYLIYILLASLFHSSAIFLSSLILLRKVLLVKIGVLQLSFIYAILVFIGFFYSDVLIFELISMTQYSHYIGTEYFEKNMEAINVITKLPKMLIVLFCAYYYSGKYLKLYEANIVLINTAYFSTGLMIIGLFSGPLWRFYQYFDFFTIIPMLVLMSKKRADPLLSISMAVLLLLFLFKVLVFPQGEYAYNSILA